MDDGQWIMDNGYCILYIVYCILFIVYCLLFNGLNVNIDWHADFQAEVPAHCRDALPSGKGVRIDIFQPGKVRLIDFVEEVLAGKGELDAVVAKDVQVHACRQIEEGIAGSRCLCIIDCIELVLSEVVL